MAEGKNSFVLYSSWDKLFRALKPNEVSKLINLIFDYVNDKKPVEPTTGSLFIAWLTIKDQLKRDLKKWEGTIEEKSTGGSMGNLKRWHKDLYNQVISKKLTLEEATIAAYHRTPSHTDDMRSHGVASIAVDVIVDDNVIVDVIDNKNNIDSRKLKFADTLKPFLEKYGKEMLNDFYRYWTESNKSKTKFKQEAERTWDLDLRLSTWAKNELKFKGKAPTQTHNKSTAADNAAQNVIDKINEKINNSIHGTNH